LEKARRETQSHLVTFGGGRPETSEHWSFFCVEKSFWAGGLAPRRGHGYALEEYAIRRRRTPGRKHLQLEFCRLYVDLIDRDADVVQKMLHQLCVDNERFGMFNNEIKTKSLTFKRTA